MLDRVLLSVIIGLLSIAGYEIFSGFKRQKANATDYFNDERPLILYFRSDSCSGCSTQSQLMEELDVDVQSVIKIIDVDTDPHLAQAYGVMSLPTTLIIDAAGKARYINYGVVNPRKLTQQWMSVAV